MVDTEPSSAHDLAVNQLQEECEKVCKAFGFTHAAPLAINKLAAILRSKICQYGQDTRMFMEHSGRSKPVLNDVMATMKLRRVDMQSLRERSKFFQMERLDLLVPDFPISEDEVVELDEVEEPEEEQNQLPSLPSQFVCEKMNEEDLPNKTAKKVVKIIPEPNNLSRNKVYRGTKPPESPNTKGTGLFNDSESDSENEEGSENKSEKAQKGSVEANECTSMTMDTDEINISILDVCNNILTNNSNSNSGNENYEVVTQILKNGSFLEIPTTSESSLNPGILTTSEPGNVNPLIVASPPNPEIMPACNSITVIRPEKKRRGTGRPKKPKSQSLPVIPEEPSIDIPEPSVEVEVETETVQDIENQASSKSTETPLKPSNIEPKREDYFRKVTPSIAKTIRQRLLSAHQLELLRYSVQFKCKIVDPDIIVPSVDSEIPIEAYPVVLVKPKGRARKPTQKSTAKKVNLKQAWKQAKLQKTAAISQKMTRSKASLVSPTSSQAAKRPTLNDCAFEVVKEEQVLEIEINASSSTEAQIVKKQQVLDIKDNISQDSGNQRDLPEAKEQKSKEEKPEKRTEEYKEYKRLKNEKKERRITKHEEKESRGENYIKEPLPSLKLKLKVKPFKNHEELETTESSEKNGVSEEHAFIRDRIENGTVKLRIKFGGIILPRAARGSPKDSDSIEQPMALKCDQTVFQKEEEERNKKNKIKKNSKRSAEESSNFAPSPKRMKF